MEIKKEMFKPLNRDESQKEQIARPSLTFWQDAWRRLKKNPLAMASLILLGSILLIALIGPFLNDYNYYEQDYSVVNLKPFTPEAMESNHWFGTDDLGRDIWQRLWKGTQISLFIGIVAASLDLTIGVLYGGISGYKGGRVDDIMMRIVEILMGIPYLILAILLILVLEPGLTAIILALSVTGWIGMARIVRGQLFQLKEQEFILAAKTLGANTRRMMLKHLIPNTMGPIIVSITFTIPGAIFTEATLSFLGLGLRPPLASLGVLVNQGYGLFKNLPWNLWFPAAVISLIMLAFNLLGDGLRDALDPKMRK